VRSGKAKFYFLSCSGSQRELTSVARCVDRINHLFLQELETQCPAPSGRSRTETVRKVRCVRKVQRQLVGERCPLSADLRKPAPVRRNAFKKSKSSWSVNDARIAADLNEPAPIRISRLQKVEFTGRASTTHQCPVQTSPHRSRRPCALPTHATSAQAHPRHSPPSGGRPSAPRRV